MRKFKKFLAKALALTLVAGSVTMGGVALQSAVVAQAAQGDVTVTADGLANGAVTVKQGSELQFSATAEQMSAAAFTWSISAKPDGVTDTKVAIDATGKLTVAEDATVGAYKVKVVSSVPLGDYQPEVTVNVTAKSTGGGGATGAFAVKINYDNYTAELETSGDDLYAFVELWKMDKEGEFSKVANTYSYPLTAKKAVVDLSYLKASAIQGIKVYGDKNTDVTEVKIAAQPLKLSLKYAPAETLAKSFTGKIGKEAVPAEGLDVAKYEYRGQYGSEWLELGDFEQINHTSAGSTIIVRAKAVNDDADATNNHPAGPEAKVKIAAAAKAPKVKIDYVKGLVTFPKNSEYYDAATGNFVAFADAEMKSTVAALRTKFSNDGATELVILVRTAADTAKKKAASNVTAVIIPSSAAATNDAATKTVTVDGSTAKVTYEEAEGKGDTKVYKFTASGASFEFSVDNGDTWKTVKDKGVYTVTMTSEAQKVLVRMLGVKEDTRNDVPGKVASTNAEVTVPAAAADGGDTTPTVASVAITAKKGTTDLTNGGSVVFTSTDVKFTATVTGSEGVAQTVTWSVADKAGTTITTTIGADGALTIQNADVTKTLVITATSTVDTSKTATFEITLSAS